MIWTLWILCLPFPPIPSDAVNMKAWTCTASTQYSVKFGDNFVEIRYFTGQNVLFWSGSIKRPDLQAAYRYRAKSFRVDSNMIGRSAVTRSRLMRVSHSSTPQLNILEILKHFWPAPEPCRQANIMDVDCIFPVRTLPPRTCPPGKHEGMNMHSSSTVVCQIWRKFRWNLVLHGSKCPILKRVHQTARSPNASWILGWILQGRFQYDKALYLSSYKVRPYAGQSQLDATIEYSRNFNTFLTCIGAL